MKIPQMQTNNEIWKDIPGYEGYYQASNLGNVKSIDRYVNHSKGGKMHIKENIMKQILNNRGYYSVSLRKDNRYKHFVVHKLIALAFIKNDLNKKYINHKDGNKQNNYYTNLEWCTCSENNQHAYDIGLKEGAALGKFGKNNPSSKPLHQINKDTNEILRDFDSVHCVERELGFRVTTVAAACRGVVNTSYGYKWQYK